jgi:hypothetical protein
MGCFRGRPRPRFTVGSAGFWGTSEVGRGASGLSSSAGASSSSGSTGASGFWVRLSVRRNGRLIRS